MDLQNELFASRKKTKRGKATIASLALHGVIIALIIPQTPRVVRLVRGTTYARFAADDVYLQLASISFDASLDGVT